MRGLSDATDAPGASHAVVLADANGRDATGPGPLDARELGRSLSETLREAVERHGRQVVLLCSFQKEESVLIDELLRIGEGRTPVRIATIDTGEIVVSRFFRRPSERSWPGTDLALTARESEVAAFLGQRLSNKAIADALGISEHTVKSHLKSIFQKTGVSSRAQVIARIAEDPDFRRVRPVGSA